MRFLVDESVSAGVAEALRDAGHEAAHATDLQLAGADDERVLSRALEERRVLVTADTDFSELLALGGFEFPSLILFRREGRRPATRIRLLLDNLDEVATALDAGAMVIIEPGRVRVRALPIDRE
ncbi:MAG: DUF5615 family PIN-like protein [Actinomycetota bacterium]